MDCSRPGLPVHYQLPEFIQTHVHGLVMPSNHLILCCPLLLPSIFPSIRVFSNESVLCQSIGLSASTSVFPMKTQDWSPLGWTGWILLQSKGFSRVFSNTTVQKHQFSGTQLFFIVQLPPTVSCKAVNGNSIFYLCCFPLVHTPNPVHPHTLLALPSQHA